MRIRFGIALALVAALSCGFAAAGTKSMRGEIVKVQERAEFRDGAEMDHVTVRTADGRQHTVRVQHRQMSGQFGVGDQVRARVERHGDPQGVQQLREMRNERTRQWIRDGSGAGGGAGRRTGSGGSGSLDRVRRRDGTCTGAATGRGGSRSGGGSRGRR